MTIELPNNSEAIENKFETFRGVSATCDLCGWTAKGDLEVELNSGYVHIRVGIIKKIIDHHRKEKTNLRGIGLHRDFKLFYKGKPAGNAKAASDAAYAFFDENYDPTPLTPQEQDKQITALLESLRDNNQDK